MDSLEKNVIYPYLLVLFAVGMLFVFHNTPLTGLDERFHFFRSLQVSQGDFLANEVNGEENAWGGCLDGKMMWYTSLFNNNQDKNLPTAKNDALGFAKIVDDTVSREDWCINFASSGSFSPLMYLPSALGLKLADMAGFGVYGKLMAGRVFNLIGYLMLLGMLFKIMPVGRIPTLFIFSFPTLLNLASSYSADPVTNMVTMLFVAYCLRMALLEEMHIKKVILLSLLTGLVKLTNVTLLPFVLLIPVASFQSKLRYLSFILGVFFSGLSATALWNMHFKFVPSVFWHSGGDFSAAKEMFISHPLHVINYLLSSIYVQAENMFTIMFSTFGGGPSLFHWHPSSDFSVIAIGIIFTYVLFFEDGFKKHLNLFRLAVPLAVGLGSVGVIYLAFYFGFSPINSAQVQGVQGRYFMLSFFSIIAFIILLPKGRITDSFDYSEGKGTVIKMTMITIYLSIVCIVCSMSIGRYISMY